MTFTPPPAWMDDTPCKGKTSTMYAQTTKGDGTNAARNICATCPHTGIDGPCLAFAIDNMLPGGVWGGYGPRTRSRITRGLPPVAGKVTVAVCGTLGGYRRHIDRKEPTCDRCRQAWAEYKRDRRATLRRAA